MLLMKLADRYIFCEQRSDRKRSTNWLLSHERTAFNFLFLSSSIRFVNNNFVSIFVLLPFVVCNHSMFAFSAMLCHLSFFYVSIPVQQLIYFMGAPTIDNKNMPIEIRRKHFSRSTVARLDTISSEGNYWQTFPKQIKIPIDDLDKPEIEFGSNVAPNWK